MAAVIDLTRPFSREKDFPWQAVPTEVPLHSEQTDYTGIIYRLECSSMCGTYIDLPGHIRETDDGVDAANCPPERFWRLPATVIHLDRLQTGGPVTAADLVAAVGIQPGAVAGTPCVIINALGDKNVWDFGGDGGEVWRGAWLAGDAVDWLIAGGCRLLVSDIYESPRLDGVFKRLFAAGVSTVCFPRGLHRLGRRALVTALFPPVPGMAQIPCRLVAEE